VGKHIRIAARQCCRWLLLQPGFLIVLPVHCNRLWRAIGSANAGASGQGRWFWSSRHPVKKGSFSPIFGGESVHPTSF
jgi:hypothetical protein